MDTDDRTNPTNWPQEAHIHQALEEALGASATWSEILALVSAF